MSCHPQTVDFPFGIPLKIYIYIFTVLIFNYDAHNLYFAHILDDETFPYYRCHNFNLHDYTVRGCKIFYQIALSVIYINLFMLDICFACWFSVNTLIYIVVDIVFFSS